MIRTFFLFIVVSFILAGSGDQPQVIGISGINPIIGDISYITKFGYIPDENTSEVIRIKTHLEYVISVLIKEDIKRLNVIQKENRKHLINLLAEYIDSEQFPKNNHFKERRPVFIDEDDNFCAVGYLIAQTEGEAVAREINKVHKFDAIKEITSEVLEKWLIKNGLSAHEAAMIQPWYGPIKNEINNNHIETEYLVASSLLAGFQAGAISYTYSHKSSKSDLRKISAVNSALGAASLTLGLLNLDNSNTEIFDDGMWIMETTYTNDARKNFSIANIVFGGASVIFNGIRFFKTDNPKEKFHINSTHLYEPISGSPAPALSVSLNF